MTASKKTNYINMDLVKLMGDRFGSYSKYIIQDRALPDIRDGLKPVQRRILYSMYKERNTYNNPYRKSAKTVGNVMGNYHPHGDSSIYDAMVRMGQDWKLITPLIDMHGNKGSIDNDPPAAMRYTEARLAKVANVLMTDIDKNTVDFVPNYSDSELEPVVLPSKFPNILVNGSSGISAGYATNIPPHNLGEVIDATIYRIKKPNSKLEDLMEIIKGPDFPTGGITLGEDGIEKAFAGGKGKVFVRAKVDNVEPSKSNKNRLFIINEIPYEVVKANLVRKLEDIRLQNAVDGILEVRDESDRNGLKIVVEIDKKANDQAILNYFYKYSELQVSYNYNMVMINKKRPMLLGLTSILDSYITFRKEVVTYRTQFELDKAKARLHIIEGLVYMVSILDEVIACIRKSNNKSNAIENLVDCFDFTARQAEAIVNLQLYRLTNTDIVALEEEARELTALINELQEILMNIKVLEKVIIKELEEVKKEFATPRKTVIESKVQEIKIEATDLIVEKDVTVTVSKSGYVKVCAYSDKHSLDTIGLKSGDTIEYKFDVSNTNTLLFFTNKGKYIYRPIHEITESRWNAIGEHVSGFVTLAPDEKIIQAAAIKRFDKPLYVLFMTKKGLAKRVLLEDFVVSRYNKSLTAMKLKDGDEVAATAITNGYQEIIITTKLAQSLRYHEEELSVMGLTATGMKGMNIYPNDEVISLNVLKSEKQSLFVVFKEGIIKKMHPSDINKYTRTSKGSMIAKRFRTKKLEVVSTIITDDKDTITYTDIDGENNTIENIGKLMNYVSTDSLGNKLSEKEIVSCVNLKTNEVFEFIEKRPVKDYEQTSLELE